VKSEFGIMHRGNYFGSTGKKYDYQQTLWSAMSTARHVVSPGHPLHLDSSPVVLTCLSIGSSWIQVRK
jgi:hypothetical protein